MGTDSHRGKGIPLISCSLGPVYQPDITCLVTCSILMSLPRTAQWDYNQSPEPGSPEEDLLDACRNPRTWTS